VWVKLPRSHCSTSLCNPSLCSLFTLPGYYTAEWGNSSVALVYAEHMRRKRLLVDVDEVLCDFQTLVFELASKLFGKKVPQDTWDIFDSFSKRERTDLFQAMAQPGYCTALQPLPGAREAIRELRNHVDVYVVTSPFHPSPTWVSERYTWLHEHFDFKPSEVINTSSKFVVVGDAILDDRPDNVTDWLEAHPQKVGMLWHIPNTKALTELDHLRVHSWDQVIEKVKAL